MKQSQRPQRAVAGRSLAGAAAGVCSGGACQQPQQCTCGIVIVDHGSRRKASNDMLVEFCQLYQQLTQHAIVQPAHMEIAEPSIAQAIGELVCWHGRRNLVTDLGTAQLLGGRDCWSLWGTAGPAGPWHDLT